MLNMHLTNCKLLLICKTNSYYSTYTQQNDRAFVFARHKAYPFSWCFIYSTTNLWYSLHNEHILAVKQVRFIALAEIFLSINNYY